MLLLARVVKAIAAIVIGIIVIGILMIVLGAKDSNDLVQWFTDAGSWLAGPFKGLFNFDERKLDVLVNWGLAALVYALIAGLLIRLLVRSSGGFGRFGRRRTVAR